MATVYSKALWGAIFTTSPGGLSPPVPAGFVWVVRDVTVTPQLAVPFFQAAGPDGLFTFTDAFGLVWWQGPGGWLTSAQSFHWEGRQVFNAGDQIEFVCAFLPCFIRVSGYELSIA